MTDKPKTFEEVAELHDIAAGLYATNTLRGRQLSSCADKIHACLAAKDRRIAKLEAQSRITEDTSDGYHTFKELYDHRHALFSAVIAAYGGWKSLHHHDGSMFDGWFIAGVRTHRGDATYHIPLSLYACFPGEEVERAPEWDGHTPQQAAERIAALSFGASLQAQIDRVRALAEELNQCAGDWGVREQIAKRILTALGEPAAELERKQR